MPSADQPGEGLREFLTAAAIRNRHREVEVLLRGGPDDPVFGRVLEEFAATTDALVVRAQSSGDIRRDVTSADVLALLCAPMHIANAQPSASPDLWRRYLALIFDGLRMVDAPALPQYQ